MEWKGPLFKPIFGAYGYPRERACFAIRKQQLPIAANSFEMLKDQGPFTLKKSSWLAQQSNRKSRFASDSFYTFSFCLLHAAFMALFRSAQRFFIISEIRRLAAALKRLRPRLPRAPKARRPPTDPRRAEIA